MLKFELYVCLWLHREMAINSITAGNHFQFRLIFLHNNHLFFPEAPRLNTGNTMCRRMMKEDLKWHKEFVKVFDPLPNRTHFQ